METAISTPFFVKSTPFLTPPAKFFNLLNLIKSTPFLKRIPFFVQFYMNKHDFIKSIQDQYLAKGVALSIKSSKDTRVELMCSRNGKYVDTVGDERKRETSSTKCGCTFSIISSIKKGENWSIKKVTSQSLY